MRPHRFSKTTTVSDVFLIVVAYNFEEKNEQNIKWQPCLGRPLSYKEDAILKPIAIRGEGAGHISERERSQLFRLVKQCFTLFPLGKRPV